MQKMNANIELTHKFILRDPNRVTRVKVLETKGVVTTLSKLTKSHIKTWTQLIFLKYCDGLPK